MLADYQKKDVSLQSSRYQRADMHTLLTYNASIKTTLNIRFSALQVGCCIFSQTFPLFTFIHPKWGETYCLKNLNNIWFLGKNNLSR